MQATAVPSPNVVVGMTFREIVAYVKNLSATSGPAVATLFVLGFIFCLNGDSVNTQRIYEAEEDKPAEEPCPMPEDGAGKKGEEADPDSVDLGDTKTWPKPPVDGEVKEGEPSRSKPKSRGEKSLYDEDGGEWRVHKPDKFHPKMHWDYNPHDNLSSSWEDIPME